MYVSIDHYRINAYNICMWPVLKIKYAIDIFIKRGLRRTGCTLGGRCWVAAPSFNFLPSNCANSAVKSASSLLSAAGLTLSPPLLASNSLSCSSVRTALHGSAAPHCNRMFKSNAQFWNSSYTMYTHIQSVRSQKRRVSI